MSDSTNPVMHQLYGFYNNKYYAVDGCNRIVIPMDLEYKQNAVVTTLRKELDEANIDAYFYHTDLTTDRNPSRVKFMKDYLLGEKITEIEHLSGNYIIGVDYSVYNKDGKVVKAGKSEVDAQWCMPMLLSEVQSENILEYRKGIILDGRIVINIPEISRYGIRNAINQHPYTIKINEVYALMASGGYKRITEFGSQLDTPECPPPTPPCAYPPNPHHGDGASYNIHHHHNGLCDVNFNSCFITNAKIGTTMIDQVVASATLEAPPEYTCVDLCHISLGDPQHTIKMDQKLKTVVLNLELFLDNLNEVYDREDINKILQYNAGLPEDPDDPGTGSDDDFYLPGDDDKDGVTENDDGSVNVAI